MKRVLSTLLSVLFLVSCAESTQNTMQVSGNVEGLKKGKLYLQHLVDTTLVSVDSLIVKGDGNFSFTTKLESPEIYYLYLDKEDHNEINDRITFFGEPGQITINTSWNTFDLNAQIKGSKSQEKLEEYQKVMSRFHTTNLDYIKGLLDPKNQNDPELLDSLQTLSEKNVLRGYLFALNFALNNTDSYVAPYVAITEVADANIIYLDSISNSLSPEVANSKYGKELKKYIEGQKSNPRP